MIRKREEFWRLLFHVEMQAEESETSSSVDVQVSSLSGSGDKRGKHRILAELKRLEQETRSLEVLI